MSGKRFFVLLTLLLAVGMFAHVTNSWAQENPTAPPAIKLVGPAPLVMRLTGSNGAFTAIFNLQVENDGLVNIPFSTSGHGYYVSVVSDFPPSKTTPAPKIEPYLPPDNSGKTTPAPKIVPYLPPDNIEPYLPPDNSGSKNNPQARKTPTSQNPVSKPTPKKPGSLVADTVTSVPVQLFVYDLVTTSVTVVLRVTSPSGVVPATESITLTRTPKSWNFWGIAGGSLVMGAFVLAVFLLWRGKPTDRADAKIIYTDATFSFTQSWAFSITGLLTVVATVFSTTGVLGELVPGIDTGFFLAVTIAYGIVLTLAPLMYSALQESVCGHVYGTHRAFVTAATITGIAVGGQLSTVGAIIAISDLKGYLRIILVVLLFVVAVSVIVYIEATRRQLWRLPRPPIDPVTSRPVPATEVPALP
jgi:hypothetical protein